MRRHLLFDGGCGVCTGIAAEVEREAGGWLDVRPLDDPAVLSLLAERGLAAPRRPTLLELDDTGAARLRTGVALTARLVSGVGVRRAARIARLAHRSLSPAAPDASRRAVLRGSVGGAVALAGLALAPAAATAAPSAVLTGAARTRAVEAARSHPQARAARRALAGAGYDVGTSRAVALRADEDVVVMTFFPSSTDAEGSAAVLTVVQQPDGSVRVAAEAVSAAPQAIVASSGRLGDVATVSPVRVGAAAESPAAYFSCITFCVGANCASNATRCAQLRFLYLMLACMVAVCGSKVNTCHKVCKSSW